jgi:adenylate cyclase
MTMTPAPTPASILVVDDNPEIRELLARGLLRHGHDVLFAESGQQALDLLQARPIDAILLDIMMPEMDGYEVLARLRARPDLRHIPVVVVSALGEVESVVRCIELGADDYLFKPFNPVLLQARVNASLEKKRLRDREREHFAALKAEQARSEALLLSIFPRPVADRLKAGERGPAIAHAFPDATILFANLSGFAQVSAKRPATEVVELLDRFFSAFDALAEQHGVEKIKTISDTYMVAGGVPVPRADHAHAVADMALSMQKEVARIGAAVGHRLSLRIGIHSGPVVAGVIGTKKLAYDLWGETVNTASQLESFGLPGSIQASSATYLQLRDQYLFEPRGAFYVPGTGEVETHLLVGKKSARR